MLQVKIFLKSFLCLLNESLFLEDLVHIDYRKELDSNMQLREATEQRKNEYLESLRNSTLERRRLLCRKLWISFLWILSAIFLSTIILLLR